MNLQVLNVGRTPVRFCEIGRAKQYTRCMYEMCARNLQRSLFFPPLNSFKKYDLGKEYRNTLNSRQKMVLFSIIWIGDNTLLTH